jgi:hypothetical protein
VTVIKVILYDEALFKQRRINQGQPSIMQSYRFRFALQPRENYHLISYANLLDAVTGSFGHHEVVHELLFEGKWIPLSAWLNRLERTGFAIVIVETNRLEWVRQNLDSIIITPMDD